MGIVSTLREAWPLHAADAIIAMEVLRAWCDQPLPRAPGMATVLRLAVRVHSGRTVDEAAGREYLYRWHLALQSKTFGVPHALGL